MRRLLWVSIAFPPKNDPECLQTGRYFKALSKSEDLEIEVITSSNPTLFMPVDNSLTEYDNGYSRKIEIPIHETKLTNYILRKLIPGGIDIPDSKFTFHWQWREALKRLNAKPDVIYSRSNPLSSAFMAYKIKQSLKVPWIMHLSDPWVDSPLHTFTKKSYEFHRKWEETFFDSADAICLTSLRAVEFYKDKYSSYGQKIHWFPNVYDSDHLVPHSLDLSGKLRIVYTGGLSGARSPIHILNASKNLIERNPDLAGQFEIIFAGPMDRNSSAFFQNNTHPNVQHLGELPYEKSIDLIKTGHILLNIDNPIQDPKMAMYFPSKLLDYFRSGRKIMTLTTINSSSAKALEKLNAEIIMFNDETCIEQFLIKSLTAFKEKKTDYFVQKEIPVEYGSDANASRLHNLIKSL